MIINLTYLLTYLLTQDANVCCARVETLDRYCEKFYHPTQCLVIEQFTVKEEKGSIAKERNCYCNSDYCNSVTISRLPLASVAVCLIVSTLMNFCCG